MALPVTLSALPAFLWDSLFSHIQGQHWAETALPGARGPTSLGREGHVFSHLTPCLGAMPKAQLDLARPRLLPIAQGRWGPGSPQAWAEPATVWEEVRSSEAWVGPRAASPTAVCTQCIGNLV